jgi:hypothetical protein
MKTDAIATPDQLAGRVELVFVLTESITQSGGMRNFTKTKLKFETRKSAIEGIAMAGGTIELELISHLAMTPARRGSRYKVTIERID